MSDRPASRPQTPEQVQERLRELAQYLRAADHLEPDAQQQVADLVEELAQSLHEAPAPGTTELAHHTAHLAQAIHQQHDQGLLAGAKRRLEESIVRAETEAPTATEVARRLMETLANLGI